MCLTHSTSTHEEPTKSIRTTLCKQRKQPGGEQPTSNQSSPCSEVSRTPLVVSQAPADSKPTRKESHHKLQCHPGSELVLQRRVLTDGPRNLDRAHRYPSHQANQAKTHHPSHPNHCHQPKQHPSDSSTTQKAHLL
jgi:hypothetical protein